MLQDNRRKFRIISGCYCHFLPFPRCIVSHQYIRLADYRWLTNLKAWRSGLILVVLDDALVLQVQWRYFQVGCSLNPYCAGRCSSTRILQPTSLAMACLNPYCAGRCSSTENGNEDKAKQHYVSILVVLDDALVLNRILMNTKNYQGSLNPCCAGRCSSTWWSKTLYKRSWCLNPCCAGRCSSTGSSELISEYVEYVSILVVLDDALVLL